MTAPLLEVEDVSFSFGSLPLLSAVSFALSPGSATALVGPNGVGKTTLLRLAAGVLKPRTGHIRFGGQPLSDLSARQTAQQIAVVPQILEVPFEYTVAEVVEQGRTPHLPRFGGLRANDHIEVDRALSLTQTTHLRYRIFNELSGGERQRVKIALGLAQNPRLLLLDEPTQNLDVGRQMELLHLLADLRAKGITILAAVHDLHLIAGNFSRVLLLSSTSSLVAGPPDQILQPARLSEAFNYPMDRHPLFLHPLPRHMEPL